MEIMDDVEIKLGSGYIDEAAKIPFKIYKTRRY